MGDFALGGAYNTGDLQMQANQMRELKRMGDASQSAINVPGVMGEKELIAQHGKLKKAAQQLEAVFFQQLLEAMDKTVDREDSLMGGGETEQTFREMMNQNVAESIATAPGGSGFGLAESMYQQMSAKLPPLPPDVKAVKNAYGAAASMPRNASHSQPLGE